MATYAISIEDKLARYTRLDPVTGCVEWVAGRNGKGYGLASYKGKNWLAHRLMYSVFVGPIPEGLVLDHQCRNHACVNVRHLEPVTNEENLARGLKPWGHVQLTHCPHGHEYTEENTVYEKGGARRCLTCRRIKDKKRYARSAK